MTRIGHGYDVHPFEDGRPLVLGGVTIDSPRGLAGHSDGDPAVHALIDALLGAAALGDIGTHFPSSDEQWRGANSLNLLQQTATLIREAGYEVGNADVTVVAQTPRLAPHIAEMRQAIAGALRIEVERVSVKATTTDGLGAVGREEGVAAYAVALIEDRNPV